MQKVILFRKSSVVLKRTRIPTKQRDIKHTRPWHSYTRHTYLPHGSSDTEKLLNYPIKSYKFTSKATAYKTEEPTYYIEGSASTSSHAIPYKNGRQPFLGLGSPKLTTDTCIAINVIGQTNLQYSLKKSEILCDSNSTTLHHANYYIQKAIQS